MNLRYPGQVADAESGLYNNWQRYYDPKSGRYLTPDPLGPLAGMRHAAQVRAYLAAQPVGLEQEGNPYVYGRNNPLRYTDPTGRLVFNAGAAAIGAAIGAISGGLTVALQGGSTEKIAAAAFIGAAGGAVAGFTFGAAGTLVVGGVSGGLGNVAGQLVSGQSLSVGGVAASRAAGLLGGGAGLLTRSAGYTILQEATIGGLATAGAQMTYEFGKGGLYPRLYPNNDGGGLACK